MPDASDLSASRLVLGRGKLWMFLIGALALAATVLLWVREIHQDELRAANLFRQQSDMIATEISEQMNRQAGLLRSGASFFRHNRFFQREEWRRFVEAMEIDREFPGIDGIGLVKRISASEREAFVKDARKEFPEFHIFPESERSEFFVNFLLEPERVYNAVGLDLASRDDRREAAERAMMTGQLAVTAKTMLVTPGGSGSDLLMFLPLYHSGLPVGTHEERRAALWGWVAAGLSIPKMMLEVQNRVGALANIVIHDGSEEGADTLLYNSALAHPAHGKGLYHHETVKTIGGRPWLLRFSSLPRFEEQVRSNRSIIILAAGVAATFLLTLAAWWFLSLRTAQEENARKRIALIKRSRDDALTLLAATPAGVVTMDASGMISRANAVAALMIGMKPEEATGKYFSELFVPPSDRQAFNWSLHALKTGGGPLVLEIPIERNQERRNISWTFSVVHDADKAENSLVAAGLDVTGYRKTENGLQAERALFISGPVVVFRWKAEAGWPVVYVSPNVAQFGCSSAALLSGDMPFINLIHPDDLGRVAAEVSRFTAQGAATFEQKYRLIRPTDGDVRWVDDRTVIERDINGRAVSYLGYLVDVTEREKAWEARRNSETRISRVLATSSEGFWELDSEWRTVAVNPALLKMLEVEEKDILGKSPLDYVAAGWEDRMREVANDRLEKTNRSFEMAYRSAKGRVFQTRVNATSLFDSRGRFLGSFGLLTDITAEKLAEEALKNEEGRLRLIVDSVPLALIISRVAEAVVLNANQAAHQMFGFEGERMNGHSSSEFYADPEERKRFLGQIRKDGVVSEFEVRMLRRDGSAFWALLSGRLVNFENAECVLIGARDVSARKEAESRLAAMAEELARSNAELEQFAYVASHDLQEPLRMIASYVQLLERRYKEKLGDDAREYIAYAVDGAKRMQTLITDLLEFSRVSRKGDPFVRVDLNQIAEEALANLAMARRECGPDITVNALPVVEGDPVQLVRLFQNLIGNALKYRHPARVPEIGVTASRVGDYWEIEVRDNGIGISEAYFERIFIIFQRLHTRSDYPGTGIGLALCKKIVERHGGHIRVEAKEGEYSAFKFTLPV